VLEGGNAKDLGGLVRELENEEEPKLIAINTSVSIARLHARAKPVENAKRPLSDIR
jgi:hypothetical protein